jgi:hypothetical protein
MSMKEWTDAKARLQEDIERKKEHLNNGSNFQSRAFVRSSWKSKNFNPNDNPLLQDSSSDEDYGKEDANQ